MRIPFLLPVLALCLLLQTAAAGFAYIDSYSGNSTTDNDDYFRFSQPTGLLIDRGTLYVADAGKPALYVFNASTMARQKAVFGTASSDSLASPQRMAYDSGKLFIADGLSGKIKTYSGVGSQIDIWNPASNAKKASGIAMDGKYLYIADTQSSRVLAFSLATKAYDHVAADQGGSDGQLSSPADVAYYGGRFFVSDSAKGMIFTYDSNFTFLSALGRGKGGVNLLSPKGLEVYNERIYVADSSAQRVVVFTMDGYPIDVLNSSVPGANFSYPEDIAVDKERLYVADTFNRLVRAFSYNHTASDDSVLMKIRNANASLSSLLLMQGVAAKLNISCAPPAKQEAELSSAQSYYDGLEFSSASSLADQVASECASQQAALATDVEFGIRQLVKVSQDKVQPYRAFGGAAVQDKIVQFDNRVSVVNAKLSSKAYSSAADDALALGPLADSITASVADKAKADTERAKNQTIFGMLSILASLDSRMAALNKTAADYHQQINLSNSQTLLDSARNSLSSGDSDSANSSLSLAAYEISSYETAVFRATAEIDRTNQQILTLEFELNSTIASPALVKPDYSQEASMMAQARQTAYSNQPLALMMARQARDSAVPKARDAQALSLAVTATGMLFAIIAVIALAFFVYVRRLKKKSL